MTDKIRQALAGMMAIVDESTGVSGYHLNGNLAEWDEFPEVSAARDTLAQSYTEAAAQWTSMSEQWPPVDTWVLTVSTEKSWTDIRSNMLSQLEDGLFHWISADDFSEITHWMPMPAVPAIAKEGDDHE